MEGERHRSYHRARPVRWMGGVYYSLGLAAAVAVALFLQKTHRYAVPSESMLPTLQVGDIFRADEWLCLKEGPRRGEIWVFNNPLPSENPNDRVMVKRVVGLPGEKIAVRDGKVLINGKPLEEPYVRQPADYEVPPLRLKPDEYYLLGDNRNDSEDSHVWGPLHRNALLGRVMWLEGPRRWGAL